MSPPKLLDQVRQRLRFRHYSVRTDQAYLHWIRRYIHFHGLRHPRELGRRDIEGFLTHLAVVEKLSASKQNQAMSALLFLYREVLEIPLPWVDGMVRAKATHREPVVLSEREVRAMLAHLEGTRWLVAAVLYSSGMRLRECLHLRVMDIDFECNEIVVRGGKGGRDRRTLFAARLIPPLRAHLAGVRALHAQDLAQGFGEAIVPAGRLLRQPAAASTWPWQFAFPSRRRIRDPLDGRMKRGPGAGGVASPLDTLVDPPDA